MSNNFWESVGIESSNLLICSDIPIAKKELAEKGFESDDIKAAVILGRLLEWEGGRKMVQDFFWVIGP